MVNENSALTDQRRFSSVLLVHPALNEPNSIELLLGRSLTFLAGCDVGSETWSAHRSEYVSDRNFYPDSVGDPSLRKRDHGYAHQVYVGWTRLPSLDANAVLLASPYVRLLQRMVRDLAGRVSGPALQFLSMDMPSIYRSFARRDAGLVATKVTLQMLSQPGLELVSLTGRNPLDSELHEQIKDVAAPYALRAEVNLGDHKARVNVDRHGNIWWYQTDEAKLGTVLSLVSRIAAIDSLKLTRTLPLERAEPDDESP